MLLKPVSGQVLKTRWPTSNQMLLDFKTCWNLPGKKMFLNFYLHHPAVYMVSTIIFPGKRMNNWCPFHLTRWRNYQEKCLDMCIANYMAFVSSLFVFLLFMVPGNVLIWPFINLQKHSSQINPLWCMEMVIPAGIIHL